MKKHGFTLIEVLFALGIFTIGFTSVVSLIPAGAMLQRRTLETIEGRLASANTVAILTATRLPSQSVELLGAHDRSVEPHRLGPVGANLRYRGVSERAAANGSVAEYAVDMLNADEDPFWLDDEIKGYQSSRMFGFWFMTALNDPILRPVQSLYDTDGDSNVTSGGGFNDIGDITNWPMGNIHSLHRRICGAALRVNRLDMSYPTFLPNPSQRRIAVYPGIADAAGNPADRNWTLSVSAVRRSTSARWPENFVFAQHKVRWGQAYAAPLFPSESTYWNRMVSHDGETAGYLDGLGNGSESTWHRYSNSMTLTNRRSIDQPNLWSAIASLYNREESEIMVAYAGMFLVEDGQEPRVPGIGDTIILADGTVRTIAEARLHELCDRRARDLWVYKITPSIAGSAYVYDHEAAKAAEESGVRIMDLLTVRKIWFSPLPVYIADQDLGTYTGDGFGDPSGWSSYIQGERQRTDGGSRQSPVVSMQVFDANGMVVFDRNH